MSEPFDPTQPRRSDEPPIGSVEDDGPPLLGAPVAASERAPAPEPEKKSPWKSWAAAGVVAAAFAGGAIAAVTISHHGNGNDPTNVQITSSNGNDPNGTNTGNGNSGNGADGALGQRFRARGTAGKVTAINGTTLTVEARTFGGNGSTESVKVATTDATRITETVKGDVSDLKVGDNVLVTATNGDGATSVTASNIVDNGDAQADFFRPGTRSDGNGTPPSFPRGTNDQRGPEDSLLNGALRVGKITKISGSTITIESVTGETVTVATNASTDITVTKQIAFSDLKVGDTVRAEGETSNGAVSATSIQKGDLGNGRGFFQGRRRDGMTRPSTTTD